MSKKKYKVGITVSPDTSMLLANGNHQNAHLLYKLLKLAGIETYKVITRDASKKFLSKDYLVIDDVVHDRLVDILLCPVFSLTSKSGYYDLCVKNNIKLVDVTYGNVYAICAQEFLQGKEKYRQLYLDDTPEKIAWISPHYANQSEFLQIRKNAKQVRVCPYIWSPEFLINFFKGDVSKYKYLNHPNPQNIAVYEPNMNYTKNCIVPAHTLKAYVDNGCLKDGQKVDIYGLYSQLNEKTLKKFFSELHPKLTSRLCIWDREPINKILNKAGTILSHHRDNSLNYTTLEALYLELPIVHNSEDIEAGYRYKNFNALDAADLLCEAVENHRDNLEHYNAESIEAIWKYHWRNPVNSQGYIDLIEEALES